MKFLTDPQTQRLSRPLCCGGRPPQRRRHEAAFAFVLLLMAGVACATEADTAAQMTVRELMHLDAELARKSARSRLNAVTGASTASETPQHAGNGDMRLEAIYGVGKKLLAEVLIGTRSHVYMHGRALPVGGKASPATYMLRGISGSCVHLQRGDDSQTLCLKPSLWTSKP